MRYGIPLLGNRIAPRCTYADSVLLLVMRRNRVCTEDKISFNTYNLFDLRELLSEYRVDTLICGGISRENKEFLQARRVDVIDNVACTTDEIVNAIREGNIHSGLGLSEPIDSDRSGADTSPPGIGGYGHETDDSGGGPIITENFQVDCFSCEERFCLRGETCLLSSRMPLPPGPHHGDIARALDAALDIACEQERTLCRLSELIYFCLEMRYKKLGIAYCIDLQEPAEILVHVLRRFFEVYPVCCKIGGIDVSDPFNSQAADSGQSLNKKRIACNPQGQAQVLNSLETDLNVIVGICMGADCIFTRASEAPVTTLFVKDRSLANNPIGALYSEYYLDEAKKALGPGGPKA
jgi:uncharacterized metal-binding protein/predicted Fe-Mo cluster-binding NifX family protein